MSGQPGRRWKTAVVDTEISMKVRLLAASWRSDRKIAEMSGIRRTTIGEARMGKPLSLLTWERIAKAIAHIPAAPPPTDDLEPTAPRKIQSGPKSPLCVTCGERRVYPQRVNALDRKDGPPRTVCYQCQNRSSESRSADCPHCGHRSKSLLEANFCCLLLPPPEARGHCGWCGEDCERPYCSKRCPVACHADRSNGLLGEGMTIISSEGLGGSL